MLRKAIATVITAASFTAGSVAFPALGNATYLVLNHSQMDQITAGDLTGAWMGSDGGIYYMRQIGNTVYWYGAKIIPGVSWPNGSFSNVAYGTINPGNDQLSVSFAGVPQTQDGGSGSLVLHIDNNNRISTVSNAGGPNFQALTFTR